MFCAVIDHRATDPVSFSRWGKALQFQGGQAECLARGRIRTMFNCERRVAIRLRHSVEHNTSRECKKRTIDMKRVLLLVFLIVSLVQLDWERNQIYLLSSFAALLLMLWTELSRRRSSASK